MMKKDKPMTKAKIKPRTRANASFEPDFRANPSGWLGWNMRVYGNDFETAKALLNQRIWLISLEN